MMTEQDTDYSALLRRAYALYQQDWCREHGYQLADWDEEQGFGSESFVCLGEFENNEFEDRDYMEHLLPDGDFILWEAWYHAPGGKSVIAQGGVPFGNPRR